MRFAVGPPKPPEKRGSNRGPRPLPLPGAPNSLIRASPCVRCASGDTWDTPESRRFCWLQHPDGVRKQAFGTAPHFVFHAVARG